jgi:hypothetical protein
VKNTKRRAKKSELNVLKNELKSNLSSFLSIGKALQSIKENELYIVEGYDTFENYCALEWDLSASRANYYIRLATAYENIKTIDAGGRRVLPFNEFQLSHVIRLPKEKQVLAWRQILRELSDESEEGVLNSRAIKRVVDLHLNRNGAGLTSLVKPSDNWNFQSNIYLPENVNGHGYISGEVYANAFWYYVREGDLVVDPMAGSGLAKKVYEDRALWMGKEHSYDFDLRLYDLTPQKNFINQHDVLEGFPVKHPDYIFMDIPYFLMVKGQYSTKGNDIANIIEWEKYLEALRIVARNCFQAQRKGKFCTVMASNSRDLSSGKRYMLASKVVQLWEDAGYSLFDKAYSPRHIQITKSTGMAVLNNKAKIKRIMLTDMTEILTFKK